MRPELVAAATLALVGSVAAEAAVQGGVEATTDLRRRGLGWSDGRPATWAWAHIDSGALSLTVEGATLRDSRRHGGADALVDIAPRYTQDLGGLRLSAGPTAHLFAGARGQEYVELDGRAAYTIGPLRLTAIASYAPRQTAIGGDSLYLSLEAEAGLPGTPLTMTGHVGRSMGEAKDARSRRLRPDGRYTDYRLAMEYVRTALTLGTALTATSIGQTPDPILGRNTGTRLAAYLRVDL